MGSEEGAICTNQEEQGARWQQWDAGGRKSERYGGGDDKHGALPDHSGDSVLTLELGAVGEGQDSHHLICI